MIGVCQRESVRRTITWVSFTEVRNEKGWGGSMSGGNGQSCPYLEAVGTMSPAEAITKAVTKYQESDRRFRRVKCGMRKGLQ
jgi:hypothetical protein